MCVCLFVLLVYHIWPYESLDKRMKLRGQAAANEVWRETGEGMGGGKQGRARGHGVWCR